MGLKYSYVEVKRCLELAEGDVETALNIILSSEEEDHE